MVQNVSNTTFEIPREENNDSIKQNVLNTAFEIPREEYNDDIV